MPITLNNFPEYRPYTNIQPFTVRDGATYLLQLEALIKWLKDDVIPHLNSEVGGLSETWIAQTNALIAEWEATKTVFEGQIVEAEAAKTAAELARDEAQQYAEIAGQASDQGLTNVFNNIDSLFRTALDNAYAAKSVQDTVETGRLSPESIDLLATSAELVSALEAEVAARNAAIAESANASAQLVQAEEAARVAADLTKRNIEALVQEPGASFNAHTTTGTYLYGATPTHTTAPVAAPGILVVEASGSVLSQRYYTETELYMRSAISGTFDMWKKIPVNPSFKPRGKITFIGDSYMTGLGMTNPATDRWPRLLCDELGATEVNLSNSGSGYVNNGSGGNFVAQSVSVPSDADTVIICGGINDAPLNPPQGDINSAVSTIVSNIRGTAPTARIVFISPMWFHNNVSNELMLMDDKIRKAVAAIKGVRYIDDAMWLRVDRTELAQGDGHPNLAGSQVIKSWVLNNINQPQTGNTHGKFVWGASGDVQITGPSATVIVDGTIYDARPGWYQIDAQLIMYTVCLGFFQIRAGTFTDEVRSDVQSANPEPKVGNLEYYHPGGNLYVGVAYRPNASSSTSVTGLKKCRVTAEWIRN